ncbi:MAG: TM0996/MTH895 family glutaredoxin-like protein [Deltaproteobacteria bacterium]|nr:TM0996/MTH895 family glutaredoxin-like protein [Deltaproteobacteria bacterium]
MKIKVLGTGCAKCHKLYEEAVRAVAETGVEAEVEKVEKIEEIMAHGVAFVPALVIDDEVKSSGKSLRAADIAALIRAAHRGE